MTMKTTVYLCVLGLLIGIGGGCRRNVTSGSRDFSHNFDSEKEEDLAKTAKMYDSLCQELESRDFRQVEMTENPRIKSSSYKEKPEFSCRVSFKKSTSVGELNATAKDFRVLMKAWCEI